MSILAEKIEKSSTVAVLGHVRPDGDCVGSCLGLYNYFSGICPGTKISVFLEPVSEKFSYLNGFENISSEVDPERKFDLCVCLDASDRERLGSFSVYLDNAADALCLDHHISNTGFTKDYVIVPDASSTCEVLYDQLEDRLITKDTAECLYTGIIHDTGVFKYSSTSAHTMEIAGKLMEKGIDFGEIIDGSFYRKTYLQNQILGRALLESMTVLNGRCIFSVVRKKDMDFYGVSGTDMDGIIDQLRNTEGVECAIFLYETGSHEYKVSLRSTSMLDVCAIASRFGGGGHVKAAGCTMSGSIHDVINNLTKYIEKQMKACETDV